MDIKMNKYKYNIINYIFYIYIIIKKCTIIKWINNILIMKIYKIF